MQQKKEHITNKNAALAYTYLHCDHFSCTRRKLKRIMRVTSFLISSITGAGAFWLQPSISVPRLRSSLLIQPCAKSDEQDVKDLDLEEMFEVFEAAEQVYSPPSSSSSRISENSGPSWGEFSRDLERNGVSPTRFVGFTLLTLVLALGANFAGVTSGLLSALPQSAQETVRASRLDQIYNFGGFRRYYSPSQSFEFLYPEQWLADSGLAQQEARDRELPQALRERKRSQYGLPTAAFGPAQSDGRENVSVLKSKVVPGFTLHGTLGEPAQAAERLVLGSIAGPSSGKEAVILNAAEDHRPGGPAYVFEYTVKKAADGPSRLPTTFFQHNIAVIMSKGGTELFTMTVTAPEKVWSENADSYQRIAASFNID
jgi:hypothetical protein